MLIPKYRTWIHVSQKDFLSRITRCQLTRTHAYPKQTSGGKKAGSVKIKIKSPIILHEIYF